MAGKHRKLELGVLANLNSLESYTESHDLTKVTIQTRKNKHGKYTGSRHDRRLRFVQFEFVNIAVICYF